MTTIVNPKQLAIAVMKSGISLNYNLFVAMNNIKILVTIIITVEYIFRFISILYLHFSIIVNSPLSSYS